MAIENAQISTLGTIPFTVPSGKSYAITNILVCNTYSPLGTSPENEGAYFDMHILKDNQPRDNKVTCVVREMYLPAGETFTFDSEKIVLTEGCSIEFVGQPNIGANLTNLSVTVSYLEV